MYDGARGPWRGRGRDGIFTVSSTGTGRMEEAYHRSRIPGDVPHEWLIRDRSSANQRAERKHGRPIRIDVK